MRIDWLDLPKLTTLRTNDEYSGTFHYPRHITLESGSHPLWMMFRHAQSHQCVSLRVCILLREWCHYHRKYSLHPSLTNRHRSSSMLLQLNTERHVTALFVPNTITSHPPQSSFSRIWALSLCEHGNNDDPHLKWWKSNQNHGQPKQWSFAINHVKSTPKHITYHTHRIPIPMKTKTTSLYHPKRTAKSPTIIPISSIATFYER